MTLDDIRALVQADLRSVDEVIRARLKSAVPLVDQVAEHIISGGGKRLRPLLVVLAGRACGHNGEAHIEAAAFIEFIHTATLLHDDVVDGSSMRRGRDTANEVFGNQASVLVGDFVYSRAFQMMASLTSQPVVEIMAEATNVIAEGEVMQLMNSGNPDIDEARYLTVIQRKTAKLFEAAAQLGAVLGGAAAEREAALARYGMHLGTSFQLVDDVLDYKGEQSAIGKNPGDDLAEGKMTLPLIRAIAVGNPDDAALVRTAIEGKRLAEFAPVMAVLERTGSLDYAVQYAIRESELAASCVDGLPPSSYRQSLLELASFAARRTY